ncbi:MAG: mRNA-decapping enzyme subunit 2 [Trizodia sp. TS-e1964]|nr:MAG: mRNA-decapping enzyme subunit 2 [Trizodia sp. TS-e1964]
MNLEDWLDDLCVRFIINLPQEELESVERICFQVEEAQWFYEDFIRPLDPTLPSLNLRDFCLRIFQHCPLLSNFSSYHHTAAFSEFLAYKTRVPVRGAIMLNESMDQVVLVKGWKKNASWSFPRGKINKDEGDLDCAIREVYEETGFDIRAAGLVLSETDMKFIDVTMREQSMRLYVFRGIPLDTHFEPKTRKEISKIEWSRLSELPTYRKNRAQPQDPATPAANANRFYMVAPFLVPLKKWIAQQNRLDKGRSSKVHATVPHDELFTEEEPPTENEIEPVFNTHENNLPHGQVVDAEKNRAIKTEAGYIEEHSARLRQLLSLQTKNPTTPRSKTLLSDSDKSTALLNLLRSGRASQNTTSIPQIPSQSLKTLPPMPPPPRHHHALAPQHLSYPTQSYSPLPSSNPQTAHNLQPTTSHTQHFNSIPAIPTPNMPTAQYIYQPQTFTPHSQLIDAPPTRPAPAGITPQASSLLKLFRSTPPVDANPQQGHNIELPKQVTSTKGSLASSPDLVILKPKPGSKKKPASQEPPKVPEIQILRRSKPEQHNLESPPPARITPKAPPVPLTLAAEPKAYEPKIFQPQILRRPAQGTQSTAPAPQSPTTGPSAPPEAAPTDTKKALLALFGKPPPAVPSYSTLVSPLNGRLSFIETINTAGKSLPKNLVLPAIGQQSQVKIKGKGVSQTSPIDKKFLLGYLEGVARGAGV